ncbi:type II secretion system protein [Paenibacillus sp. FSL R7-0179]|uniref:type II secretion system protein n=1 Tax=Paenibacillus sp. FSL R7-0179 TaxID=2921672 RepID=UPI0030F55E5C
MLANAIKKRLSKEEGQKGFTLIELLAVIVILGIIAVIAIPLIGNIINKSKEDSDLATARQVYDAARLYVTAEKNGAFKSQVVNVKDSSATDDLTDKGYIEGNIYLPSNKEVISGGTVTFDASGNLTSVILYTSSHTPTGTGANAPISFTGEQVLSQKKE